MPCVTTLGHLKNISPSLCDFSKMVSCDFRRVITISDKIDVGPLKALKK